MPQGPEQAIAPSCLFAMSEGTPASLTVWASWGEPMEYRGVHLVMLCLFS